MPIKAAGGHVESLGERLDLYIGDAGLDQQFAGATDPVLLAECAGPFLSHREDLAQRILRHNGALANTFNIE